MYMYDILRKKRLGNELTDEEIKYFVKGFTSGDIPDYQASALLMAVCINGMTERETLYLTDAMARSGELVDLSGISGTKVDKHSTGGVGDKTSLIVCPIVAACGVPVAKMSGRSLGHTGGTLDKLESIPGMQTALSMERFFETVNTVGFSIIGQTKLIAPADKKIYELRDLTATVDSIPLIASSIMSKKIASGADAIVLDIKTGSGAFMKNLEDSLSLAKAMITIGKGMGRKMAALITDMDVPLGHNIGNSLEVIEAVEVLLGGGSADLIEICTELSANMILLGRNLNLDTARALAADALLSGKAYEKLCEMVSAQGGDVSYLKDTGKFKLARTVLKLKAGSGGYITHMDTELIGLAGHIAGMPQDKGSADPGAGIVLIRKTGDSVSYGDEIAEIYASSNTAAEEALKKLNAAVKISASEPVVKKTVLARMDNNGTESF